MSTRNHELVRWTCHAGDIPFTIEAPAPWAAEQQRYLTHYLPGHDGGAVTRGWTLAVHTDGDQAIMAIQSAESLRVPYVPGVELLQVDDHAGGRYLTPITDGLEDQPGAFAVHVQGRAIDLHLRRGAPRGHSYPLRLIREVMLRSYENAEGLVLHAAGIDIGGRGIVIIGPRSAGKTTTLAALLRSRGSAMLSNDRLIVDRSGMLIAVPLPVPVAYGTVSAFPELQGALAGSSRTSRCLDELPRHFGATSKAELSAREFATSLGSTLTGGARLHAVIVPRFSSTDDPAGIRRLEPDELCVHLVTACFTPHDEFWINPWLLPRTKSDRDLSRYAHDRIAGLAGSLAGYELHYGIRTPITELSATLAETVRSAP